MYVIYNIIYGEYVRAYGTPIAFNTYNSAQYALNYLLNSYQLREGISGHTLEEYEIIPINNFNPEHYIEETVFTEWAEVPHFTSN